MESQNPIKDWKVKFAFISLVSFLIYLFWAASFYKKNTAYLQSQKEMPINQPVFNDKLIMAIFESGYKVGAKRGEDKCKIEATWPLDSITFRKLYLSDSITTKKPSYALPKRTS